MFHEPVLKNEVCHYLINNRSGIYLDGTAGGGGHSESLLNHLSTRGKVICLDLDEDAIEATKTRLDNFGEQLMIRRSNFRDFDLVLREFGISYLDGILLDLGVSSHQLDQAERGFSYSQNAKLDMRMNSSQSVSAYDIVNKAPQTELNHILKKYGEERHSSAITREIINERKHAAIETTRQLAAIITKKVPHKHSAKSLSRVFQALRIAVNEELQNLVEVLTKSMNFLKPGSRIVVLSYHSLEDRIVKRFFKQGAARCNCPPELPVCVCNQKNRLEILTPRVVRPDEKEISRNQRSRSAKLRAAEYIKND